MRKRRWIDPQDFQDLRKRADLKRHQAAHLLDVTTRTIQNWETGGARIPWMAYRMLRILTGYALPGKAWVRHGQAVASGLHPEKQKTVRQGAAIP